MSYLHGSPSVRLRRETDSGGASTADETNINQLAASRAAWKLGGGKFTWVGDRLVFNPAGHPEPQRPGTARSVLVWREKRSAANARMVLLIEEAIARPYSRPPTTRGKHWFVVFTHDSKRLRFPIKTEDVEAVTKSGLTVVFETGRKGVDE